MLVINKTTVIIKPYDRVNVIPTPKSEPIEKIYNLKRDEKGNSIYIEVGERNINDYVNSFAKTSSLDSVLSRIQFMTPRDKISYLQQTEGGISADMSAMPTDATEAFIVMSKYKDILPQVTEGLRNGLTLDAVLKQIYSHESGNIPNDTNKTTHITNSTESEVTENV